MPDQHTSHDPADAGFETLLRQRLHQLADHAPTTVHTLDEIRVQHARPDRVRREGRHRRAAGIGATVAALLGGIGFTAVALNGAGSAGAASPEDAVRTFLEATADQDVFGMIDALDPTEVPAARAAAERGRDDAVAAGLVTDGFRLDDLAGLDVEFADLALSTDQVAPDLAVVSATGSADWTFDPATFPFGTEILDAVGDDLSAQRGSIGLGEGDAAELDPAMLATVERDGRWYVSVSYTIGEYARRSADLPMPTASLSPVGSPTPEAAADEFWANMLDLDLAGGLAQAAPGEGDAVRRYAPLLIDQTAGTISSSKADGYSLRLTAASYEVSGDGDRRTIVPTTFTIEGTVAEAEQYGVYDPSLATVISPDDGSGFYVVPAGQPVPLTVDGLELQTDYDLFPSDLTNYTNSDSSGIVTPLPEKAPSTGPLPLRIERAADGCTTFSGDGTASVFGPIDESMLDDYTNATGFVPVDTTTWRNCDDAVAGISALALFSTTGLTELPAIQVVEVDGQWYVSPVGTLGALVLEMIDSVRDAGSLLDSPLAFWVIGIDRATLEYTFNGLTPSQLSPECQAIVTVEGGLVTGARDDMTSAEARACWRSDVYSPTAFEGTGGEGVATTGTVYVGEDGSVTEATEVPASVPSETVATPATVVEGAPTSTPPLADATTVAP